jgi:hypothetical protein
LALTEYRLDRHDTAVAHARAAIISHARTGHRLGEHRARAALALITADTSATRCLTG